MKTMLEFIGLIVVGVVVLVILNLNTVKNYEEAILKNIAKNGYHTLMFSDDKICFLDASEEGE